MDEGQEREEQSSATSHASQAGSRARIDDAWRAYTRHTRVCGACGVGINCQDAVELRMAWRKLVPRV